MLKKFLVAAIFLAGCSGNVFAQEVTVTGMGSDKDSAIRDATRLAVEQVAGTFIDSRTLMENLVIQLDEVYKSSSGFVKNIRILDEGFAAENLYRVQATIDVDTEPNSDLIDKLTMIMQLNDPRIAVAAFDETAARKRSVEGVLVASLVNSGFSHVKDTGTQEISSPESFRNFAGTDYLVLCRCSEILKPVKIPAHENHAMTETSFVNARSILSVDVIKCDTGEVIGTFSVEGSGVEDGEILAKKTAIADASKKAADKLTSTFKKFSANTTQYLAFTLIAADEFKLEKIIAELRALGKIDSVRVREISGTTAALAIDSAQKPYEIVSLLKNRTKLGVFVENMTNSSCTLRIN